MSRVLVIDDEPGVRGAVRVALGTIGAEVLEAENADAGLRMARSERPDIVVCDLNLGGRSGYDVLEEMRRDPVTATMPLILITGGDASAAMRRSMDLGADDFLQKPFGARELIAAIHARMQKRDLVRAEAERINQRLRCLLEATGDLVAIVETDGVAVQYMNRAARQLTGLPEPSPAAPVRVLAFLSHESLEQFNSEAMPAAIRDGAWRGEARWKPRSGEEILVRQEVLVHRGRDGAVDCLSLIAHDITEETRAADQVRTLSRAIEQTPLSIVITDPRGRIEYVNPHFETLTGYTMEEAKGQTPRLLKSGHQSREVYEELWRTLTAGREWTGELCNRKKSGELYWEQESISPVRDQAGRITHFIAIKQDITGRKRAETERNRTELQLRHAQKLQAIGHLASGIAHEINTPVQFIGDNTRFLRETFDPVVRLLDKCTELMSAAAAHSVTPALVAECRAAWEAADVEYLRQEVPTALAQTLEGVDRISRILKAMKDFSHPDTSEKAHVDLNKLIESTLTICRNEWKYVADVVTHFDPALTAVPCLPGEFNQVMLNLIVNAAHAIAQALPASGKSKGTLTVTTGHAGKWAEVRIADTGTGIAAAVRPHIFEPFFTTKQAGKGTGQGLAIAHSVIVDKHKGTIHFETETGKGTTFIVRLPMEVEGGAPQS